MKSIFFLGLLLVFSKSWSQITLTKINAPRAEIRYWFNKANLNFEPFKYTGTDTIWDFSNIIIGQDSVSKIYTRDSSFNPFPNNNYQPDFSDTTYLKTNLAVYRVTNSTFTLACRLIPVAMAGNQVGCNSTYILKFPFTYLDSINQNWHNGLLYGKNNVKSDGFGTLILPGLVYTNTLRVHTYIYEYDEPYPYSPHAYFSKWYWDIYDWYDVNSQMPIFSIVCYKHTTSHYGWVDILSNDTSVYVYSHLENPENLGINLKLIDVPHVTVYPNPASDQILLDFISNTTDLCKFELLDMFGIIKEQYGLHLIVNGSNNLTFDLNNLKSGVYFLKCFSDNKVYFIKKILIN